MKKYKALIFDFNGVLLLDIHLHFEVWKKIALEISGKSLTRDDFEHYVSGRTNELTFEYLTGRKLDSKELESWTIKKELAYQELARQNLATYKLAAGTISLLDNLRQHGTPYTIATSSPAMNIKFYDETLDLKRWFDMDKIAFDDGTLRGKPAPDLYIRAAQLISVPPEDCIVIEDARSGIAAAQAAGIGYIIAIGPKDSHEDLRKVEGVDETIESLAEVDVPRLF